MHELGLCAIPNCSSNTLNTCRRPQSPYAPYNSRGEYTLPPSVDSRASTSTRDSDSTDILSASVASPSTVPVQDNSAFNRFAANPYSYPMTQMRRKYFAIQHANFSPTLVFLGAGPRCPYHTVQPATKLNQLTRVALCQRAVQPVFPHHPLSKAQIFGPGSR
ncbi:hypothetical protein B0H13DRAFT_2055986 [Mycena leptocephala]|nr:hypothetical protein B0H13DRAFT_2055986 [Mycena leptocephala]